MSLARNSIELLKEDAEGQKVSLLSIFQSAVHGHLMPVFNERLELFGIPLNFEEWTMNDIRKVGASVEEGSLDNYEEFERLMEFVEGLAGFYDPNNEYTFKEFGELLLPFSKAYSDVLKDMIKSFAGAAGFEAMGDLIEIGFEGRGSREETDEVQNVTEEVINHVRSKLSQVVFPEEKR